MSSLFSLLDSKKMLSASDRSANLLVHRFVLTGLIAALLFALSTKRKAIMSSCLHESLSRPIYLTSQTIRNYAERILKPFDLASEPFHLLKNRKHGHGLSQSALCGLVGKSPANITRILDRLESKGIVKTSRRLA
jgi:hypothetical protein